MPGDRRFRLLDHRDDTTPDDDKYRQALAEAEARLEIAQAQFQQARADAATAARTLRRVRSLNATGIAATAELDTAQSDAANARAATTVAGASISEAKAQVETARVPLGYTHIKAHWPGNEGARVVGERMAEPGDTVAANTPTLTISVDYENASPETMEELVTRRVEQAVAAPRRSPARSSPAR